MVKFTSGKSGESLAPECGGNVKIPGVNAWTAPGQSVWNVDLNYIMSVMGVEIKDLERFEIMLHIKRIKQPGSHNENRFTLVSAVKPYDISTGEKLGVPGGHSPVGPETD